MCPGGGVCFEKGEAGDWQVLVSGPGSGTLVICSDIVLLRIIQKLQAKAHVPCKLHDGERASDVGNFAANADIFFALKKLQAPGALVERNDSQLQSFVA